jgi:hypothetical protein
MLTLTLRCRAEYALPETASDALRDFLAMMIQPDAAKRYTAQDAMKHYWVLGDDQTEDEADVRLSTSLRMSGLSRVVAVGGLACAHSVVSTPLTLLCILFLLADGCTQGLLRQMSSGPIATIDDDTDPELWMGKLEACRQAADVARDAALRGDGVRGVQLVPHSEAEEGVAPGEGEGEPSMVTFDDSDGDD